jgi:Outer membrane efflux protein
MLTKLKGLEGRAKTALGNSRALTANQQVSPITSLTFQRELVEVRRSAQELQRELSVAKTQLAALMNLPPDSEFTLSGEAINTSPPVLDIGAQDMISAALHNRSELRDIAYQQRINEREACAALLELLPGIQLYEGNNFDSNKYLDNNRWVTWGAKAGWNMLRVFQYPAKAGVIEGQDRLLDARALALTMAVMTQVHVSRIRYFNAAKELRTAREYFNIQNDLVTQMRKEAANGRISEQTLIREELNTLVAEAKRDIAFAAAQNAFANVFASIGLDPYSNSADPGVAVSDLANQLKQLWLERGDFGGHRKINLALQ